MNTQIENLKPNANSSYKFGWQIMKDQFISLFLILLIIGVATIPVNIIHDEKNINTFELTMNVFGLVYILFILNPIKFGANWVYLKAVRRQTFEVKEVFDSFKNYLNVVLTGLLVSAIVGIGLVFLIIPGIVFACRLTFVPFLVMDKNLDPVKAVEESWRLTKGHGWQIFWMYMLAIPLLIAGLCALIFGVLIVFIWIRAAFASMYYAVLLEKGETGIEYSI